VKIVRENGKREEVNPEVPREKFELIFANQLNLRNTQVTAQGLLQSKWGRKSIVTANLAIQCYDLEVRAIFVLCCFPCF